MASRGRPALEVDVGPFENMLREIQRRAASLNVRDEAQEARRSIRFTHTDRTGELRRQTRVTWRSPRHAVIETLWYGPMVFGGHAIRARRRGEIVGYVRGRPPIVSYGAEEFAESIKRKVFG